MWEKKQQAEAKYIHIQAHPMPRTDCHMSTLVVQPRTSEGSLHVYFCRWLLRSVLLMSQRGRREQAELD